MKLFTSVKIEATQKRSIYVVGNVDSRDLHRIAQKCAGQVDVARVLSVFILTLQHDAQISVLPVTTPALPFIFRVCHGSHHERTTFSVIDLAATCGSEPVVDGLRTAVVGSDRTSRVLDASSGREDESSDVCCVGETR